MALPIYNSKEGHETPSLLDSIIGAMDEAWQTGTTWLEKEGTEFLESYPEADINDPESQQDAVDTVFNTMGGGLGTIGKQAFTKASQQAEINGIIGDVMRNNKPSAQPFQRPGGGLAKQADAKLLHAKDTFAFNKGTDPIAYMREAKTPNQVMASWDKLRHDMSNYEVLSKTLTKSQHEAWAKEMYTEFADALKSQGMATHAKIIMHQLSQRGNKVKQSYNSTVK